MTSPWCVIGRVKTCEHSNTDCLTKAARPKVQVACLIVASCVCTTAPHRSNEATVPASTSVTSGGLDQCKLAASSQMANDFPQWHWLRGNKQIPLGRSLATSQAWNLSGTQLDGEHKLFTWFFHGLGFSFLGALVCWLLWVKQFSAFACSPKSNNHGLTFAKEIKFQAV